MSEVFLIMSIAVGLIGFGFILMLRGAYMNTVRNRKVLERLERMSRDMKP